MKFKYLYLILLSLFIFGCDDLVEPADESLHADFKRIDSREFSTANKNENLNLSVQANDKGDGRLSVVLYHKREARRGENPRVDVYQKIDFLCEEQTCETEKRDKFGRYYDVSVNDGLTRVTLITYTYDSELDERKFISSVVYYSVD